MLSSKDNASGSTISNKTAADNTFPNIFVTLRMAKRPFNWQI